MPTFLVTRTDRAYEPIRVEAEYACGITEYLAQQDHLAEMASCREGPMKRSYMRHAIVEETSDPPEYKLVVGGLYGRELVEV